MSVLLFNGNNNINEMVFIGDDDGVVYIFIGRKKKIDMINSLGRREGGESS